MSTALIEQVKVLSPEDCNRVRLSVHELSPLWDEERFRLGAGISYYKPPVVYYATAKLMNPILEKHLGWMYDQLLSVFSVKFNCSVAYRKDLALPGFNIYNKPSNFSELSYNVHVDLQYKDLNWDPEGSADFETTMSFTVPIVSPLNGTGLNIWNVTQLTDHEMEKTDALAQDKAVYQSYDVGIATIHDGKHYHQMCITKDWTPADERITLQGHGVMQNGSLIIYG